MQISYLNMKWNIDNKSLTLQCDDIAAAKYVVLMSKGLPLKKVVLASIQNFATKQIISLL